MRKLTGGLCHGLIELIRQVPLGDGDIRVQLGSQDVTCLGDGHAQIICKTEWQSVK